MDTQSELALRDVLRDLGIDEKPSPKPIKPVQAEAKRGIYLLS